MLPPNEITAFAAFIMLAVASWGFRFSVFIQPHLGIDWLTRGIWITLVSSLLRALQWDVLHGLGVDDLLVLEGFGGWLNALWNLCQMYAAYCFLRALHLFIPPPDRSRYNWFKAAFYPHWPKLPHWPRLWKGDTPDDP